MLYKAVEKDRNPEAIRWAIDQRHLGEAQYKVLIALARMADQNAIAQILAVELSDWVGISTKASRKALLALRRREMIRLGKVIGQDGFVYSLYELNSPGAWEYWDKRRAEKAAARAAQAENAGRDAGDSAEEA